MIKCKGKIENVVFHLQKTTKNKNSNIIAGEKYYEVHHQSQRKEHGKNHA